MTLKLSVKTFGFGIMGCYKLEKLTSGLRDDLLLFDDLPEVPAFQLSDAAGGRKNESQLLHLAAKISDDCCRDCGNEQLVTLTMRSADCQLLAGARPRFTFISLILIRHTSDWPAPRRHSLTHSRFPSLSRISSLRTTGPFPLLLLVTLKYGGIKYYWDGTSSKMLRCYFWRCYFCISTVAVGVRVQVTNVGWGSLITNCADHHSCTECLVNLLTCFVEPFIVSKQT